MDIEDEDDSDDLLKGYEVVGESEPYVHGTSGMLNPSFGRRRPVKAKEKSGDGIIPQDIIVHHSI